MGAIQNDEKNESIYYPARQEDTDACWISQRAINNKGYATMGWQGKTILVHRRAYEQWVGAIPEGLTIDHPCRNKQCYNPAHPEAVTNRENILRSDSPTARNARKTHCVHGHPLDATNAIIRKDGRRRCRTCTYQATSEWAKTDAESRTCSPCSGERAAGKRRRGKGAEREYSMIVLLLAAQASPMPPSRRNPPLFISPRR